MRVRKLSPTGDYTFGQSLNNFWIDQPEGVGQSVQTRLQLWLGEWYLDTTAGTPYIPGILGKNDQATADLNIQDRVLQTDGVTDLKSYASILNPDTRGLSVALEIDTAYGPTAVQIANYGNY